MKANGTAGLLDDNANGWIAEYDYDGPNGWEGVCTLKDENGNKTQVFPTEGAARAAVCERQPKEGYRWTIPVIAGVVQFKQAYRF